MPLSRPGQASGFTLIELMFGIAVLIILMTLSMPSFQTWMQNIQIRNASESILTGIQKARSEAVTRNTSVSFVMGGRFFLDGQRGQPGIRHRNPARQRGIPERYASPLLR